MIDLGRRQYRCARVAWMCVFVSGLFVPMTVAAQTIVVASGGDLQAALDAVEPGGTVLLEAGAIFAGKYTLPPKSNPDGLYITIRSSASDTALPPEGDRITPAYSDRLPKIQSTDTLQGLHVLPGASYWRIQCLEFLPNVSSAGDIIRVGSHLETVAANQPHHIVFDRVYVHGDPVSGQKNGIVAHAAEFTLRDSYVSDIKLHGVETHAFASYNGPGPYLLENNYLEASSINIMFGGTDPRSADMVPSDITIRRNHVAKNVQWMQPRPDGTYWNVKNLLELKVGRRVLIEGNIFEHNWKGASDQSGYAVLLRSESQGGACNWCETGPVTFENNIVRHTPAGLSLIGLDYVTTPVGVRMHDVTIRNNLFDDINRSVWYVGSTVPTTRFALINGVDRLTIDHNTLIMPGQTGVIAFGGSYDSTDFVFTNNMSEHKTYGVKGDGTAIGSASLMAYTTAGYSFTANVLAGGNASSYPAGNYFPPVATWTSGFVEYLGGDGGNYRLAPTSPYKGVATDGTDLGADIERIEAAIGVLPNGTPSANGQAVTTPEDTPVPVLLTGSDPDGDPLTFGISDPPLHGTLSGAPPNVTYTSAANYNGSDSFTFAVEDRRGGRATGTVVVTVTPVNDMPVANDQSVTTPQDTAFRFTLDASDPDGEPLRYEVPASIPSGMLTQIEGGTYEFTPNAAFVGTDSFVYQVDDPSLASATATVTLTVTRRNAPPVANAQSVATSEDVPVSFTLNASDPDGDPLTYSVGAPASGTLSGTPPNLTYAPHSNFNGADSFTYSVTDTLDATATATVSFTVFAVNDAPVAAPMTVTIASGTSVNIALSGSDVDGDALTWSVAAPQFGTLSGTPPSVTYTSGAGFVGTDSFAFTVSDGVASSTAAVTIQVTGNPVTITTTSLADGRVGKRYSQHIQATGGGTPYAWSVIAGALPPGLTLGAGTGRLTGTPTAAGTYSFVVEVVDRWSQMHSRLLSIRVLPPRQ